MPSPVNGSTYAAASPATTMPGPAILRRRRVRVGAPRHAAVRSASGSRTAPPSAAIAHAAGPPASRTAAGTAAAAMSTWPQGRSTAPA